MQSNYLGLLGLAKKAGLIEAGDEAVRAAISAKRTRVVLIASDASDRTREAFEFFSENAGVPHITVAETREELGNAIGKRPCAAIGICDIGISAAIVKKLSEYNEEAKAVSEKIQTRADKISKRKKTGKRKK